MFAAPKVSIDRWRIFGVRLAGMKGGTLEAEGLLCSIDWASNYCPLVNERLLVSFG